MATIHPVELYTLGSVTLCIVAFIYKRLTKVTYEKKVDILLPLVEAAYEEFINGNSDLIVCKNITELRKLSIDMNKKYNTTFYILGKIINEQKAICLFDSDNGIVAITVF